MTEQRAEYQEIEGFPIMFNFEELHRLFPEAGGIQAVICQDDALAPKIRQGDALLYDAGAEKPTHGGIFLFRWSDGKLRARRVRVLADEDGLVLLSSHPDKSLYPDEAVSLDHIDCMGRVLWSGGLV